MDLLANSLAAKYAKPRQEAIKSFPISELDWFRKNAYNMAILRCHEWQEDNIIRLSSSCISFVSCYPPTISTHQANELASTLLRCHFLISVCLLKQAQRCKDLPKMHHCYAEIRHHTTEYKNIFHSSRITDIILHQDLASKMTTLLVYDFEAAISLGQFEDLQTIIGNAKLYKDIQALKCLGDILLQYPIPAQGTVEISNLTLLIPIFEHLARKDLTPLSPYHNAQNNHQRNPQTRTI